MQSFYIGPVAHQTNNFELYIKAFLIAKGD
jgi:hypothetical protein